jgi:catechol 2,3-dioxygenase-like lactoylglutathione lyase family enzyme
VPPLLLRHLALLVHDLSRSRRFYETYFGFGTSSQWFGETLFVRNAEGFDLALMRGEPPPNPGAFHHFGFQAASADAVRQLQTRLQVDGVSIVEEVEEPDLVSFKCIDPDGYTVEVYCDPTYQS